MNNFKALLLSFLLTSAFLWLLLGTADGLHPRLPCMNFERRFWQSHLGQFVFERVSSFYWSSLCSEQVHPVIISASEGTGGLTFAALAARHDIKVNEFKGAHRGLKTLAYLLASPLHPERQKNLKILAFINPVYFSFAASTDSSSIRLTSISSLSYFARLPAWKQKWDEYLLDSFFIGARTYLDELKIFFSSYPVAVQPAGPVSAPHAEDYDLERNMLKEKAKVFTSFRSPFTSTQQPSRFLFEKVVDFAHNHRDAHICYVMLPMNSKNLRFFDKDPQQIQAEMSALINELPQESRLDLQFLNEEPFLFLDPMHLSDFGKERVMDEVMKSPCARRVFQ